MAADPEVPWTQFRIFISSTFEDLKAERAVLAERVFPQLRTSFQPRGVSITDVDLRWGITQDESILGRTLELCLAEAEACRPYVLVVLGERYGWIPEIPDFVRARYPWIASYTGRSITELEIRCALHEAGRAHRLVFCYARETGAAEDEQLALLKRELALLPHVRFGRFADVAAFEAQVVADLRTAISEDAHIDPAAALVPALRRAYNTVRIQAGAYRPVYRRFAEALAPEVLRGGLFALTGTAGSGKTTAMLQLIDVLLEAGAVVPDGDAVRVSRLVLPAFLREAGTGQDLRDLIAQLVGWVAGAEDPDPRQGFRDYLDRLRASLERAADGPVVILIDDVEGLERDFFVERFLAFAATLPRGSACVIAVREDAMSHYVTPLQTDPRGQLLLRPVPGYPGDDVPALVHHRLAAYGKRVSDAQLDALVASPLATSPAFLMAIIDELRLSATFASLDVEIQSLREVADSSSLYATLMSRRRASLDAEGERLLTGALRLLAASELGLREHDMRLMLGGGAAVPALRWSPVYLGVKPFLREYRGRLAFRDAACRHAALTLAGEDGASADTIGEYLLRHAADDQDYVEAALQACRPRGEALRSRLLDDPEYLVGLAAADWTMFKRLVLLDVGDGLMSTAVFRRRARYEATPPALALLAWAFQETGVDPRDAKYQQLALLVLGAPNPAQAVDFARGTIFEPEGCDLDVLCAETVRGDYGLWTQLHRLLQSLPYDACVIRGVGRGLRAHLSTDWSRDPVVAAGGISVTYYIGDGQAKAPNGFSTEMQPMLRALKKAVARRKFEAARLLEEVRRTGTAPAHRSAGRLYVNWLAVGTAVAAVTGNRDYASMLIASTLELPLPESAFAGVGAVARYLQRIAALERDREFFCRFLGLAAACAMRSGDAAATAAATGEIRQALSELDFSVDRLPKAMLEKVRGTLEESSAGVAGSPVTDTELPYGLAAGVPVAMRLLRAVDMADAVDRHLLADYRRAGYVLPDDAE